MRPNQKEGCIWMSIGALLAFWMIVYGVVRIIAMARKACS